MDDELNHYALQKDIDNALIFGGEVVAKCGERFEPALRVGSGGLTDNPDAEICPDCQDIDDMEAQWRRLRDERDRLERELINQREAIANRRRALRLERTFASPSVVH